MNVTRSFVHRTTWSSESGCRLQKHPILHCALLWTTLSSDVCVTRWSLVSKAAVALGADQNIYLMEAGDDSVSDFTASRPASRAMIAVSGIQVGGRALICGFRVAEIRSGHRMLRKAKLSPKSRFQAEPTDVCLKGFGTGGTKHVENCARVQASSVSMETCFLPLVV